MPKDNQRLTQTDFEPLDAALVRAMVGRIEEILPLPSIVNALLKSANDPYVSLGKVADIILKDQALTARILKIINSAYYGLPHQIVTVSQAVSLLGLEKIKNLAMAISLADRLYHYSGLPFGRRGLYQHSQACGVATHLVAQEAGYPLPEEALIAGLLHDIAKALWAEVFPERLLAALRAISENSQEPLTAEKDFLTVDHPTLGAWMLANWQLPEVFQVAVRHHHQPQAHVPVSRARFLSQALFLGNYMSKLLNLGNGGNFRVSPIPAEILKSLRLTRTQLAAQLAELPKAFLDFAKELDLEAEDLRQVNDLIVLLQERQGLICQEGEEPGPASLFFEAFAPQARKLPPQDWPKALTLSGKVLFWEGDDPNVFLTRLRQAQIPSLRSTLLFFCHRPWSPEAVPTSFSDHTIFLGPQWRLVEIIKAISRKP